MQNFAVQRQIADESYVLAFRILIEFTQVEVLSMREERPDDLRHMIIGNFITRDMNCLDINFLLWKNELYQDCWSLHRTPTDGFFAFIILSRPMVLKNSREVFLAPIPGC